MRGLPLVFLLLAGCATPAVVPTGPAGEAGAPFAVLLSPCVENAADIPVDVADAQRFLPQGVKPAPLGPTGMATLEVIAVRCGEEDTRVHAFVAWMVVQPPEALRASNISLYLYLFAMSTDDPATAAALQALGVNASLAPTSAATDASSPLHVVGRGSGGGDGWAATLDVVVPKRETMRSHPVFRLLLGNATGISGAVDVDAGAHPHYDVGEGSLVVTGAPPFPTPKQPGISVHGWEGHLGFMPVVLDELASDP